MCDQDPLVTRKARITLQCTRLYILDVCGLRVKRAELLLVCDVISSVKRW